MYFEGNLGNLFAVLTSLCDSETKNQVESSAENLGNLFAVLKSLCDSETKNQVESSAEYKTLEKTLDSMGLLSVIKRQA